MLDMSSSLEEVLNPQFNDEVTWKEPQPVLNSLASTLKEMGLILKDAGLMAGSFTFSYSLIAVAALIGRLAKPDDVSQYLGAISLILSVLQTETLMMGSPLYALGIEAGKYVGRLRELLDENDPDEIQINQLRSRIRDVFRSGILWSLLITPFMMYTMSQSDYILKNWFGQNAEVAALAGKYLSIFAFALPGYMLRMTSEQVKFAFGKIFPAMGIGLVNFAISTLLAIWLSFGSPDMGIPGVALAYSVDAYLTAIGFSLYIAFKEEFRPLNLFGLSGLSSQLFKTFASVLATGLPIGLELTCKLIVAQLLVTFAGQLTGDEYLAAQSMLSQLTSVTIIPLIALGQTVAQKVSRAVGQSSAYASKLTRLGLLTSVGLVAPIAAAFAIKPEWLGALMTHHDIPPEVLNITRQVIPLTAVGIVADTVCYGTLQVLRVANQKLIPTLVSISIMALGLLAAYLLGFTSGMNLFGLELGSALSTFMTAMVLMPMWISFTSEKHFDDVSRAENQIVIEGEESIFKRCKSCFFGSQTLDLQNDISDSDLLETDRLLDTNQTRVYEV